MRKFWLLGVVGFISSWIGCGGGGTSPTATPSTALLDTVIEVPNQKVTFSSMKKTFLLYHMPPSRSSALPESVYQDLYLTASQCSVKVVSELFITTPKNGPLRSYFTIGFLHFDQQVLDSIRLPSQSGADSGWLYSIAPLPGKNGVAGKAIIAAKGNRGYYVGIGVKPDSLSAWRERIDSLIAGVRFTN